MLKQQAAPRALNSRALPFRLESAVHIRRLHADIGNSARWQQRSFPAQSVHCR